MDDVLHLVLAAHGGLGRWLDVSALTAHLSVGGPFPVAKGWPDMLIEETVEASARREHIVFTPPLPPPVGDRPSRSTPRW